VWFGSSNEAKVFRARGGKVDAFTQAEGVAPGSPAAVQVAVDGKIWVTTPGGCGIFDGGRFQPVDPAGGGQLRLARSRTGGMWATRGGKLLRYGSNGDRAVVTDAAWLDGAGQVNALHEDRQGTLWTGTLDAGLICYRDGGFRRVPTSFNDIACLSEDAEGNLWIGRWGGGLNRLSPRGFFLRQTKHGLRHDAVNSLCEDREGRPWILGRDGTPMRASDEAARSFAPAAGWSGEQWVSLLCADPRGGVWLGTPNGLMCWENDQVTREPFREPVGEMFMDRANGLWIATSGGGVFRFLDGNIKAIPGDGGLVQARAMAEDSGGRIWIGTRQGDLFRSDGDRFVRVALPGAGAEETVRFIVPDGKDSVWTGTLLGGLVRWKDGEMRRVPGGIGISLAEIRSLVIEPGKQAAQDTFWIGMATGLFRVPRGDLEGVLEGRRQTMNVISCGSNEGLPNAEFAEGFANSAIQAQDGHHILRGIQRHIHCHRRHAQHRVRGNQPQGRRQHRVPRPRPRRPQRAAGIVQLRF